MRRVNQNITAGLALAMALFFISPAGADTGMRNMLNLTGARQVAMGETAVLHDADPFNLEYNPAAIIGLTKGRVGFSYNSFIQDRNNNALAAIFPVKSVICGIHARLAGVGDIEVRQSPTTEPDYIAGSHDFALKAFAAYKILPRLQAGISAGWLMEKIDVDRASIASIGFGAVYYAPYDIAFHASVSNLAGKITYITQKDDPPTIYRAGAAYQRGPGRVAADYVSIKSGEGRLHMGGEYLIQQILFLRAGYQIGYDNRNFSAGVGFVYMNFRIDYAFVPYKSDLGNSHQFTLIYAIK
jgi:hypothetical protein